MTRKINLNHYKKTSYIFYKMLTSLKFLTEGSFMTMRNLLPKGFKLYRVFQKV